MQTCYHRRMTDDLATATRTYKRAQERSDDARTQLADAVRTAYAAGMRKADIIRAIDHVWSREWLDRVLAATRTDDGDQPPEPPHSGA